MNGQFARSRSVVQEWFDPQIRSLWAAVRRLILLPSHQEHYYGISVLVHCADCRMRKRVLDVVGSLILIMLTSPIMLLAALAIWLEDRGPVFFRRLDDGRPVTRVGQGKREFPYFKFRSMRPNSHSLRYTALKHLNTRIDGPLFKTDNDPRVTRVGKVIRRYSVDELPELFLVLAGHMSLVGPRPHLPEEVALYEERHCRVFGIKPGITGLAQVSGRADNTFEKENTLDAFYAEYGCAWMDALILFKTPFAVFQKRKKGAY